MLKKHDATDNRHLRLSDTKVNHMKGMATNTQLNDHVTSDVNRHSSGKTFVTPMHQNSPTTVMCSSKKHPLIEMSTVCRSPQKVTVPSAKENLLCTTSMPSTTNKDKNGDQVPLDSSAKGGIIPMKLDFDNQSRKVVADMSQ
eukprot:5198151-Ditylum_brightwellii.AAC.1